MSGSGERTGGALLYFEDVQIGQAFRTASCIVTAEEIRAFAAQFDPQPFHVDADVARASMFGGLIASGWHTAAITMRLMLDGGPRFVNGSVGLGAELTWRRPVRADDRLHVVGEVIDTQPHQGRPDRGRVIMRVETRNQHDEVVQLQTARVLVPRRPQASA